MDSNKQQQQQLQEQEEGEEEDQFDRLPEALIRLIFNKVIDAKSLTRCLSVSKRFASIIPQTDTVSLTISPRFYPKPKSNGPNFLKSLIHKFLTKPLHFLYQIIVPKSSPTISIHNQSPNQVLDNFKEIRFLKIELPCHSVDLRPNGAVSKPLLKWKAEFGKQLESCVILGATSFQKKDLISKELDESSTQSESDSVFTNDELKLRVVWTISCLIAASARHLVLQEMVSDHGMLESVVVSDACEQGKLCMREEQIVEMRSLVNSSVTQLVRTRVPALRMKLWYMPVLELPGSGWVMKGATLVVIRPIDDDDELVKARSDGDLFAGAFDGEEEEQVYGEAVRAMLKMKKTYVMEMNSF